MRTEFLTHTLRSLLPVLLLLGPAGCADSTDPHDPPSPPDPPDVPTYTVSVVREYPHDPGAFTQGLEFEGGFLYEGTGRYGQSTLRKVELETGTVVRSRALDRQYFGEGITLIGDRIFQVTFRENRGFLYDRESFEQTGVFSYPSQEGWGLATDGADLILSDGTNTLYFLDPDTFDERRRIAVSDRGIPVARLNELEVIDGEIWANVWLTDRIARIDPSTGNVLAWIDLTGLLSPTACVSGVDVLNGIAHDAASGRIFVTGKLWCRLFEIELVPPPDEAP